LRHSPTRLAAQAEVDGRHRLRLHFEGKKHMNNFAQMSTEERAAYRERVAVLNDAMRAKLDSPAPNIVVMTAGILAMVDAEPATAFAKQIELMEIVAKYDAFTEDVNPHGERDFGAFEWQETRCYWKIDYYDRQTEWGSTDPADPAVTCRVLTILRADEY